MNASTAPCAVCGKPDARLRCGRCRSVHYCDASCQKNDWKDHKSRCAPSAPRLETFERAAPRCVSCQAFAWSVDERVGPWMCYRSCCGAYQCEACERRGAASRVGSASPSACPRCGEPPAADDATAFARCRARADDGAEDAIYVLGATLLYGLRGRRLRPEAGLKLLRKLIEAGEEDGAEPSYFIGAANYAVAQARRQKFVTWPDKVAPLLRRAAACGLARAVHELGIMYEAGDEGPKDGKEAARLAALAADAGLRDAKRTLARMYVDGEHVPRDPEKAARLIGLERTADLWRDGEGPKAPGFLFSAPRPDGEAEASRPIAKDEYSPAEMDAFFGPEGAIT